MHKGYSVSLIDEVILNTYKSGIKPGINLLLGFPGETEEDFLQTCELVQRNGKYVSYVNISILGIEPFTQIYSNKEKLHIDFQDSVNWQTADGINNYQIRVGRTEKLQKVVNEYVEK